MKKLLCLTTIVLMSFSTFQNEPIDRIGVKGPIIFNNTRYHLSTAQRPNVDYYFQEYVPIDEAVKKFNQLITVNVFIRNSSLENAVQQKAGELNKRMEKDKVCNYSITQGPDGKDSIIDCVLSYEKDGEITAAEFVIYRFKEIELQNHTRAILIYSYSKRSYDTDIFDFFTSLPKDRKELLDLMSLQELPKIRIKE